MEEKTKKKSGFLRTVAGKTLLFIVINLSGILLCLSILGFAFSVSTDLYHRTPEEYMTEQGEYNMRYSVIGYADSLITDPYFSTSVPFQVVDKFNYSLLESQAYTTLAEESKKNGVKVPVPAVIDANLIYDRIGNIKGFGETTPFTSDDSLKQVRIKVYADPKEFSGMTNFDINALYVFYSVRNYFIPAAVICFFVALSSFIALMCVAGKRPGSEEIVLGPLGKFPFDVMAVLYVIAVSIGVAISEHSSSIGMELVSYSIFTVLLANIFLGLCVSFAARVKLRMLIKGSLIYKIWKLTCKLFKLIWKGITAIPLIWATAIGVVVLSVIEFFYLAVARYDGESLFGGWFAEKLILVPFIFYIAYILKKLAKSGEKIAKGDITYRAPTKGLWGDFKKHAENLNAVSDSVTIAVEERLKSERMKTELITNVSHDIKTPLTSIINYANLIGTTDPSDPKLGEYSEVIVRQSEKLKRLIEDLVEASKASTGNLEIVPSPLDCCTFVSQTAGEFKEKLDSANLTLITNVPDEQVMIMADGRHMMRVYDNLMNNICKYSMPGTRVYISLNVVSGQAVTVFKNTSSAELNISPEELVERFVRGDKSRNTEGNGLGLSIAQSMTELQGGKFKVEIDGDLFKVTLSFPVIK